MGCKCGLIADASLLQVQFGCDIQGCSLERWSHEHGSIISDLVIIKANTLAAWYTMGRCSRVQCSLER